MSPEGNNPFRKNPLETHEEDRERMQLAISLSSSSPEQKTYKVGCVITDKNGKVLMSGFTGEMEGFHAEEIVIKKLKLAGLEEVARGGSIYSTIEPCHPRRSGKTSCTDHILSLGVSRVIYVLDEPKKIFKIAGPGEKFIDCQGAKTLRERGLEVVHMSELEEEVREINQHILKSKG